MNRFLCMIKGPILFFCLWISNFPSIICWRDFNISTLRSFAFLVEDLWLHGWRFISELSVLFYWSMYLSLFQYHAVLFFFLITLAWLYILKLGSVRLPVLFFLLKIVLTVQNLSWFYMNFRINFSISIKNVIDILVAIALICRSNLPVHEHISFFSVVCVLFNFFQPCFVVLGVQVFHIFG